MTKGDIEMHAQLVLFIIIFYVRFWTEAPLISLAASNDLSLFKALMKFNLKVGKLITPSTITSTVSLLDLFGLRSYLLANLVGESTVFLGNSACTWDDNESFCHLKSILISQQ